MNRALGLGALGALFFASTFVLNRILVLGGGSVLWLAGLRYLFTIPLLGAVVVFRREWPHLWTELRRRPGPWLLWGTIGFGLFYLPLTWAAHWAPAWLVAGSWQLTIVLGSLLVPFVERSPERRRIPVGDLWPSGIILLGVLLAEWAAARQGGTRGLWALLPIVVAAIAYPLGNRQMMRYTQSFPHPLSVYQRTLGMTVGSLPFWLATLVVGWFRQGWPTAQLTLGALAVAFFSGVVATLLFFAATDRAQGNTSWLARIEATQSLEIVFTVLLATLIFGQELPTDQESVGLAAIMAGMVIHSLRRPAPVEAAETAPITWLE